MRVVILFIGIMLLINAIIFLLSTESEINNAGYAGKQSVNRDMIGLMNESDALIKEHTIDLKVEEDIQVVEPSSQYIAPQEIAPQEIAGQEIAPQKIAPQKIAPQKIALPEKAVGLNVEQEVVAKEKSVPVTQVVDLQKVVEESCYKVGPFLNSGRASTVGNKLKEELNLPYIIDARNSSKVEAVRVYTGPYSSLDAVAEARSDLISSGFSDHFFKKEGEQYIVSLGIYVNGDSAEKQFLQYKNANIVAELRTELIQLPKTFWLKIEGGLNEAVLSSLSQRKWQESSVGLRESTCEKTQ